MVRYDNFLNELFTYGTYGQGQSPGLLDSPRDIGGYYINRLNGSNNHTIYKDLLFVTEKWNNGSGQTYYFIQPKYITDSFVAKGVWQAPGGGGGGIVVDEPIHGGPAPDGYDESWLGTYLRFNVSDICYLKAWIYNDAQTQLVRTIWDNNRLTMPGKVAINWNGEDDNGNTFWAPFVRLNIRVQSVYAPQRIINYSFRFNPGARDESDGDIMAKLGTEEDTPQDFKVFGNSPNPLITVLTSVTGFRKPAKS